MPRSPCAKPLQRATSTTACGAAAAADSAAAAAADSAAAAAADSAADSTAGSPFSTSSPPARCLQALSQLSAQVRMHAHTHGMDVRARPSVHVDMHSKADARNLGCIYTCREIMHACMRTGGRAGVRVGMWT